MTMANHGTPGRSRLSATWPILIGCRNAAGCGLAVLVWLASLGACGGSDVALPKRLILAIDGVAYRDMRSFQEGVTYTDRKGKEWHRQGFHKGYFPASRLVSTFPSASDVAWTEIFGNRPLPGYQRTYYSQAANAEIFNNGVTTSMEYEREMTWRVEGGFHHAISYVFPRRAFRYALRRLGEDFFTARREGENYYAFILATDDAQHLACDVFALMSALDQKVEELRTRYRALTGRDLEVLILSDHGNNHAGPGKRLAIRSFLRKAGYRVGKSIEERWDVVLPTAGIESWVEMHNSPVETERLLQILTGLEGVDVLTAQAPGQSNRFIVMNSKDERAVIDWKPDANRFRYSVERGDPIGYRPVLEVLSSKKQLDAEGFAPAEAWLAETMTHRYPVALERIARGHTRVVLNRATILISLNNEYVHAGWFIKWGSEFVTFGGTHGALDDLNSNGFLLSNYTTTPDTCSSRVAGLFGGFPGRRDYRSEESGAEWVLAPAQTAASRGGAGDESSVTRDNDGVRLRVWAPCLASLAGETPVEVTVRKIPRYHSAQMRRGDPNGVDGPEQQWTLGTPLPFPGGRPHERTYTLPPGLVLEPAKDYEIVGRIRDQSASRRIFELAFRTDRQGRPIAQ